MVMDLPTNFSYRIIVAPLNIVKIMGETNPFFLLFTLLFFASFHSKILSQELVEQSAIKMCDCIELNEYKNASEVGPCYDKLLIKHENLIQEYYDTKELSEVQINEFFNKIAAKTASNCEYIKENFPTGIVGEKRTKQSDVKCDDLKEGEFYYLTQRPASKIQDTTFVSISKDNYYEKMRNRTTYSYSKIVWKDNCRYDLIFEKSDDPFKKELIKKGELFRYEIIANEEKSFFVEIDYKGTVFQYQIFKTN